MVCAVSNGHVIDDVMKQISRKRFELETWYQLPTNRKWPMVDRMMTTDDVKCPSKVKIVIPVSLRPVILQTAQDRDSFLTWHHLPPQPHIKGIKIHLADICTL